MLRSLLRSFAVLLLAASPGLAAVHTVEFTVEAGARARRNEPVCVPLQLPPDVKEVAAVEVVADANDKAIVGQLTTPGLLTKSIKASEGATRRDLHFILPELAEGKRLTLTARIHHGKDVKAAAAGAFRWEHDADGVWTELRHGDRPVLRYIHEKLDESSRAARERTFKVFHHVYDPDGEQLLTNGPNGPKAPYGKGIQFPHHRGLFYGFMKCSYDKNTVDIWHCKGDTHQAHRRSVEQAGPVLARQLLTIEWNGVGKKTFALEQREVTVYAVPGGTLIGFTSELTPTGSPVKLDGDPQHAGFHFRASNEVAEKTAKQTVYTRPDGVDKPGATRNWDGKGNKTHINLPWLAMSFVVGKQRYTAAYLDRPENPKEARFSERNYGRFGSYFVTTVSRDKPLLVDYRIWLQKGDLSADKAAALSQAFVDPVKVTRK